MEFPITELFDYENGFEWIRKRFHPKGQHYSKDLCSVNQSREFRHTCSNDLQVQRCLNYSATYNLYAGTVFQGSQWTSLQVVLLMRGIRKSETTRELASELELNYKTVLAMRHRIQANAELERPTTSPPDEHSETDEIFQNAEKR